jgi:RHS repeat-associated protein
LVGAHHRTDGRARIGYDEVTGNPKAHTLTGTSTTGASSSATSSYAYNDNGQQTRATVGGVATDLAWTDTDRVASTTVHAAGTAISAVIRYYHAGSDIIASRALTGALSWLATDDQDTAQVAVKATSLAVRIRKQDPFGNPRGTNPAWPNSKGFVGGTSEPTGLVHLGARMYDPTTGRFISDDEVTDPDNPQQLNAYAYNNPITFSAHILVGCIG